MPQIKNKTFCFRFNYIFLVACEVLMCVLLRKEGGIRVCSDVIFQFCRNFFLSCRIEILQNLKQFAKFNTLKIFG